MAMEMHVFSDRQLNSIAEWQRAVTLESYALQFSDDVRLDAVSGLVPVTWQGRQTGFECYRDDAQEAMNGYGSGHFSSRWKYALGFRWLGDIAELQVAWMAATAYARATGGIIFDPEAGRTYSAPEAAKVVSAIERLLPAIEAARRQLAEEMIKKRRS